MNTDQQAIIDRLYAALLNAEKSDAFESNNYDEQGEFNLSLSANDYEIVIHALVVAGTTGSWIKGTDAAAPYDGLRSRLMDWNHCDTTPE